MDSHILSLVYKANSDWSFYALEFSNGRRLFEPLIIKGEIVSENKGRDFKVRLFDWKKEIAKRVFEVRDGRKNPAHNYCVTIGMRFNPSRIHRHRFNYANYVSPICQGIAVGLFSNNDPSQFSSLNPDILRFKHLLTSKLKDASASDEGIIISVSSIL